MRLMPAPASGPSPSLTSPSTAAPPRWPGARAGEPTRCWAGCTPITPRALTRLRSAAPAVDPLCAQIQAGLGEVVHTAQRTAATPPVVGADPAPRWTLHRLVGWVRER